MHHSIVDNNIEEQRSKSETKGSIQGAFNVASNFQVFMLIKHCKKVGSCGLNIFSVCTNVIFKFAFHFHFLVFFYVQQFYVFFISSIWVPNDQCLHLSFNLVNPLEVIIFYTKYICKFVDCLGFVSKATLQGLFMFQLKKRFGKYHKLHLSFSIQSFSTFGILNSFKSKYYKW